MAVSLLGVVKAAESPGKNGADAHPDALGRQQPCQPDVVAAIREDRDPEGEDVSGAAVGR
jgi:hypothetical protein